MHVELSDQISQERAKQESVGIWPSDNFNGSASYATDETRSKDEISIFRVVSAPYQQCPLAARKPNLSEDID
jgi:hypothetical protein